MPRPPMPASIKGAIAAIGVAAAVQVALVVLVRSAGQVGWANFLLAGALLVGLLAGVAARKRLAWLWGRYLGFFLAAAMVFGLVAQGLQGHVTPPLGIGVLLLGIAIPLVVASVLLGRRTAHTWFGLVCPDCGALVSRGDFLMRKARCTKCTKEF